MTTAYLALDLHAATSTLGLMNERGTYLGDWRFPTAESELIPHVVDIEAQQKVLALEESTLSFWVARTLRPYVDEIFVAVPKRISS